MPASLQSEPCNHRLDPDGVAHQEGFTLNVRDKGHWGTGDLELTLKDASDFDKAKPLIQRAYDGAPHAS